MPRGLDFEMAQAALKRAAHKALHGTHEERSGRFMARDEHRDARTESREKSGADKRTKQKA